MASYGLDSSLQDRVPLTRSSDLVLVLNTAKGVLTPWKKSPLARQRPCDIYYVTL